MNGIRVQWTRRREENMEAFLTFDQARTRFGLGGTPDNLVRKRVGQVASQAEILAAAEELGDPELLTWGAPQVVRMDFCETDYAPDTAPHVCRACQQPLPGRGMAPADGPDAPVHQRCDCAEAGKWGATGVMPPGHHWHWLDSKHLSGYLAHGEPASG